MKYDIESYPQLGKRAPRWEMFEADTEKPLAVFFDKETLDKFVRLVTEKGDEIVWN